LYRILGRSELPARYRYTTSHSRTEKGLEISVLAWLDITDNCAYGLSVEQTPSTGEAPEPETTRIDVYLEQLTRVVSEHHLRHLRYVITDGYYPYSVI